MNSSKRAWPVLLLAVAWMTGCTNRSNPGTASTAAVQETKRDPWPEAASILRRQPDLGGARQAISLLAGELADNPNADAPPAMTEAEARMLAERLRLSPGEIQDASSANYSNLDAAYLVECLILRDAIRSLDLGNLPPERKLRFVFEWVCRQVYLRQAMVISQGGLAFSPPLPPQYSLARGYGSGMDRAYLFLAAIRQLGWDGCLIGPPDRETAASIEVENNRATKGPFWAVGARLEGGEILLYDPWRGEPFPGPGGQTGSLSQVLGSPDMLRAWREDKDRPWDVPADAVRAAAVYVAAPLSAISPRMKMLEGKIASEVGLRLHVNLAETMARIGPKTRIWSPSPHDDKFCLTRALPSFLPVEEGGTDPSPQGTRLYDQVTKLALIPLDLFSPPSEIRHGEVRIAIQEFFVRRFGDLVVATNPRERISRGQFNEVIRGMVERERQIAGVRERARLSTLPDDAIAKWADEANSLYEKLSLARLPQNQAGLPDAQASIDRMWREGGPVIQMIEERRILPICAAEVGYYLAVCKHEQAERASIRLARSTANDRDSAISAARNAWLVAKDAWNRYFAAAAALEKTNPDRKEFARRLADRASRLAADPAPDPIK